MASVEIRHSPCLGSEKGKVKGVKSREITPAGSPCMLRGDKQRSCSKEMIDEGKIAIVEKCCVITCCVNTFQNEP